MKNTFQAQYAITTDLFLSARKWRKAAGRSLASHGITEAVASALIWIARLGNGVRQIEVASYMGIEGASLVRLINQLEALKLIERRNDDRDGRAKGLWLTEEGATLAAQMEQVLAQLRRSILAGFSESELDTAARVLKAFNVLE